ncbi:hypothetical protein R6Q57_025686 [Mikania cordata]
MRNQTETEINVQSSSTCLFLCATGSRVDMKVDDVDQDDGYEDIDSGIGGRLHSDSYETGSQHESSDDDDESIVGRRGPVAPTSLPEPRSREQIFIIHGEFINQGKATHILGETLQVFWSHPWTSWKDISKEDENMMFDRFKDKLLGRPTTIDEIWMQSHGKKWTRPLDKLLISKGGERSQEAGNLDEIDLQTTVKWVDTRANDSLVSFFTFKSYRYGDDASKQPLFDPDSWIQAVGGGKKAESMVQKLNEEITKLRQEKETERQEKEKRKGREA